MAGDGYIDNLRRLVGRERLMVPSVAASISNAEGRLLLQRKSAGQGWSLPAGAIEIGETPEQAIMREVREETGFLVEPQTVLAVFGGADYRHTYPNGDQVEYLVVLYRCRILGEAMDSAIDKETERLDWFAEADMPPLALPYPMAHLFQR